ncbi:TetR/AcrR family transcriptional regulator [Frondihabitans australicus]|uniref:TetR family transcriptional regulator n=1 Tax=Frondihabitans australicus TaxID=386892 RepID=A0A495IIX6_9MICO|nr:TetR/AcrR family transcriptional regulator [Frondihabitans australicus]RKR75944.1 TetR family transcriptional regulator [Frondihabitans australicus]
MPDESATRPLRADARRNREAIIAAAREVFDGDAQLRFDDFAARAGVGVGTLYRHFPTREALAAAVYAGEVTALCDRARESSLPAGDRLDAFVRGFVDYIVTHAALARTLATLVDSATQTTGGDEVERTVVALVEQAQAAGAVRPDVPPGAVLAVLHGIGASAGRPGWPAEARSVAEIVLRGLRPE